MVSVSVPHSATRQATTNIDMGSIVFFASFVACVVDILVLYRLCTNSFKASFLCISRKPLLFSPIEFWFDFSSFHEAIFSVGLIHKFSLVSVYQHMHAFSFLLRAKRFLCLPSFLCKPEIHSTFEYYSHAWGGSLSTTLFIGFNGRPLISGPSLASSLQWPFH